MAQSPEPQSVELGDEHYHVRFRDPGDFSEIRTPRWASNAAQEISTGSKVRMGDRQNSDDWVVQSVLIPKHAGEETARREAQEILEKVES